LNRDPGDAERDDRVELPNAEQSVCQQPDENGNRKISAKQVL
jgi:hypothetical protein